MISPHTARAIFLAKVQPGVSTFDKVVSYNDSVTKIYTATSWEEAMAKAAEYMDKSYYGADEYGTQRISYIVYLIPNGWSTNGITQGALNACKSLHGMHVEEEA